MVSKAVFARRVSADIAGGISIGLYACNISNTIIHVNEGFVKGFVVFTDKLTKGVVNVCCVVSRKKKGPTCVDPNFSMCFLNNQ